MTNNSETNATLRSLHINKNCLLLKKSHILSRKIELAPKNRPKHIEIFSYSSRHSLKATSACHKSVQELL